MAASGLEMMLISLLQKAGIDVPAVMKQMEEAVNAVHSVDRRLATIEAEIAELRRELCGLATSFHARGERPEPGNPVGADRRDGADSTYHILSAGE